MIQWRCDCGAWVDETYRAHVHESGISSDNEQIVVHRRHDSPTQEAPTGPLRLNLTGYA